jgi:hypothetical protein
MAPTLQDALNLIQQGDKAAATGTLATIVKSDPNNETAWLMLSSVLDDNDKKRQCLGRVLAINPNNSQATQELLRLQQPMMASAQTKSEQVTPKSPSVESVQCPKCGGPVDVTPGREALHCTYCGAGLRITRGASGHAMATLDDIKEDTSLLARDAMYRRLEADLLVLEQQHDKLQSEYGQKKLQADATQPSGSSEVVAIICGAILGELGGFAIFSSIAYNDIVVRWLLGPGIGLVVGIAVAVTLSKRAASSLSSRRARQRAQLIAFYGPKVEEVLGRLVETKQCLVETKQRMEQIKSEMYGWDNKK